MKAYHAGGRILVAVLAAFAWCVWAGAQEFDGENPFDGIRQCLNSPSPNDQKIIQGSFAYAGESGAEDATLPEVMKRNEKQVRLMTDVAASGSVAKYIREQNREADTAMLIAGQTKAMRAAVRFLCNAAWAAHVVGDERGAGERLTAAVKLAGAAGASRSSVWQLARVACLGIAWEAAQTIYRESAVDADAASELSAAFYDATGPEAQMAALRSIWEDADLVRDFNAYIASDCGEPVQGTGDSEAVSHGVVADIERGGMNLGARELREQFRRDVEANETLRQRVLGTVTWPFYTLPKDEFWNGLVAGKTNSAGLPLTIRTENLVTGWIAWSNNELARGALLDIVFQIRKFEAAKGRLPETLEELSSFVQESMKTGDVCFALLGFVDVYSGEAYRYTVTKDDGGKAVSFKVYSVGIDLRDDGGVERPGQEGRENGSDIVFEGRTAAGK